MTQSKTPFQLLSEGAALLGIKLDKVQLDMFNAYLSELKRWNKRFNLTAITDDREIVIKHFLDSISILSKFEIHKECSTVDVGSGAGLPGIPLKIVRQDIEITLLESSLKKAEFLKHVVSLLGFTKTSVAAERAEDFGRKEENRERFCLAVSRAVADLAVLVEYALPLVRIGGRLISYKSKEAHKEVARSRNAINLLGGSIEEVTQVVVPFLNAERYLISVLKVSHSPQVYPRRAGIPAKRPLL
ncbi:MAG: 16S rRNA (guanine(527)-N(7))-methyltransferase RsmG [Actinomycetota bacterium]